MSTTTPTLTLVDTIDAIKRRATHRDVWTFIRATADQANACAQIIREFADLERELGPSIPPDMIEAMANLNASVHALTRIREAYGAHRDLDDLRGEAIRAQITARDQFAVVRSWYPIELMNDQA
ncbi:hypothetical protein [Cupriavidus pampae]|uniref:Uncharacterized protein n=1 Tax=Cupriavidus pampae TaxID=659251 RepID=A0ABM8XCN4_9BURK|nr:hypothetical protein [Cupriavidus pampae]CAG9177688.1 hypothetical protein LMG32289_03875 [Cupriavidus pampae]